MKMQIEKKVDPERGLTSAEAATSEKNVIEDRTTKSYKSIFLEHTFTLFNVLNFVLALLVAFTGSYRNMLFMGIVIMNMVVGLFQELRSKRVLDKLALVHQDQAAVLRDGRIIHLPIDQVVRNDIVILSAGDQLACDGICVEGSAQFNESMLTGESKLITKTPGDSLLSGSFVVSGTVKMQVLRVGEETYVWSVLKEAKRSRRYPSMLRDSIQAIIRFSTWMILPMGLLLFGRSYFFTEATLNESILSTVAAVVGMIPEGLVFLTSIALSVANLKLARQDVLVQELYCVETLARVDTLCLDKTGTLTEGRMQVSQVKTFGDTTKEQVRDIIGQMMAALADSNPTARAMRDWGIPETKRTPVRTIPFSSDAKASAVVYPDAQYIVGAYSFVFAHPDLQTEKQIQQAAEEGKRVLCLAKARPDAPLKGDHELLALLFISDILRPDIRKIMDYFKRQDVSLRIISGDDPATVAAIAHEAGVDGPAVSMQGLTTTEEIRQALTHNAIFGRVTPEQKKEMVQILKTEGHTVAMTGDGVNDVMALREADCSIAMGSGSQAARAIASLVLLDDQFPALPEILRQGRCVINNIQRTASLFLVKTLYSFGLSLLTLFWFGTYPFAPIQLTLISALCTGFPSFVLTFEPSAARVKGHFLTNVFSRALPGAVNVLVLVSLVQIVSLFLPLDFELRSTICTILAGINSLCVLFHVCKPLTPLRWVLIVLMSLSFVFAVFFLRDFFFLSPLNWPQRSIVGVLGIGTPFALHYLNQLPWFDLVNSSFFTRLFKTEASAS